MIIIKTWLQNIMARLAASPPAGGIFAAILFGCSILAFRLAVPDSMPSTPPSLKGEPPDLPVETVGDIGNVSTSERCQCGCDDCEPGQACTECETCTTTGCGCQELFGCSGTTCGVCPIAVSALKVQYLNDTSIVVPQERTEQANDTTAEYSFISGALEVDVYSEGSFITPANLQDDFEMYSVENTVFAANYTDGELIVVTEGTQYDIRWEPADTSAVEASEYAMIIQNSAILQPSPGGCPIMTGIWDT